MSVGCDDTCVASFVCLLYVPLVVVYILLLLLLLLLLLVLFIRGPFHVWPSIFRIIIFFSPFLHRKKELLRGKKNARRRAQSVGWEEARSER